MKVLAIYTYRSPEGTVEEGSDPINETRVYFGNMGDIFWEIADNYDSKEFFTSHFTEAQVDLQTTGEFHLYDRSAGQYVKFRRIDESRPFTDIVI